MKKFLLMGCAALACFMTVCGCDNKEEKKDNNSKDNTEEKTKVGLGPFELKSGNLDDQQITDSLKLTNTRFVVDESGTAYYTSITNSSNTEIGIYELHIIIKNAEGQEMTRFRSRVDNLAAGETKTLGKTGADFKLEGYKTIEYKIIESAE